MEFVLAILAFIFITFAGWVLTKAFDSGFTFLKKT